MNSLKLLPIWLIAIVIIGCKCENTFDVTKYGADVKGVNKSSSAIARAIEEAVKVGGGEVYFPEGQYLTGAIHLQSNVTLHLADNAIIRFSTDFDDYLPMVRMRWEGTELINFSPLIYANNAINIGIKGRGVLDGQGKVWWDEWQRLSDLFARSATRDTKWQKTFFAANNWTQIEGWLDDLTRVSVGFLRPPFIQPFNSTNITIEDITVRNSPFWNLNPVYSDHIVIRGVRIEAPYDSPNTDGIDPDSCRNVRIQNVTFDLGDDCIAIKSGRDQQGRDINRPTENVEITDCTMKMGVSGVAIGSEESGGVRNVTVSNCVFIGTDRGIFIKSRRGRGGVVENVRVSNISLRDIRNEAVYLELSYAPQRNQTEATAFEPFSVRTPVIRNIDIRNMSGNAGEAVHLIGLDESAIENVRLVDLNIMAKVGLSATNTRNLMLENFSHTSNSTL